MYHYIDNIIHKMIEIFDVVKMLTRTGFRFLTVRERRATNTPEFPENLRIYDQFRISGNYTQYLEFVAF